MRAPARPGALTRRLLAAEDGVFIPGLIGAGILLSIVMLAADAIRKVFPVGGARGRVSRVLAGGAGRAEDLAAVCRGEAPRPCRVRRVPRPRPHAAVLGGASLAAAASLAAGAVSLYRAEVGLLADRGWTLGAGYSAAGVLALSGTVWVLSAGLGARRPGWLGDLARWGPIGAMPDLDEHGPPLGVTRIPGRADGRLARLVEPPVAAAPRAPAGPAPASLDGSRELLLGEHSRMRESPMAGRNPLCGEHSLVAEDPR